MNFKFLTTTWTIAAIAIVAGMGFVYVLQHVHSRPHSASATSERVTAKVGSGEGDNSGVDKTPVSQSPQESSKEPDLPTSCPEAEGIDIDQLIRLAGWVKNNDVPIFSILISRHGNLIFELYASRLTRDHAHYLMSITKSVLSA